MATRRWRWATTPRDGRAAVAQSAAPCRPGRHHPAAGFPADRPAADHRTASCSCSAGPSRCRSRRGNSAIRGAAWRWSRRPGRDEFLPGLARRRCCHRRSASPGMGSAISMRPSHSSRGWAVPVLFHADQPRARPVQPAADPAAGWRADRGRAAAARAGAGLGAAGARRHRAGAAGRVPAAAMLAIPGFDPFGEALDTVVPWALDLLLRLAGHDIGRHVAWNRSSSRSDTDSLLLRLEGFEGPLDLLLDLARAQKVDLAQDLHPGAGRAVPGGDRGRAARAAGAGGGLAGDGGVADLAEIAAAAAGGSDAAEEGEARGRDPCRTAARAAGDPRRARPGWRRGRSLARTCSPAARRRITPKSTARGWRWIWPAWCAPIWRRCGAAPARQTLPAAAADVCGRVQDALQRLAAMLGSLPDWTSLDEFLPDDAGVVRWSGGRRWRARCWPGLRWRAAARCGCGRSRRSARSWCGATPGGVEEGA